MAIDVTKVINTAFLNGNQLSIYSPSNVLGAIMYGAKKISDPAGIVEKLDAHFAYGVEEINFPVCTSVVGRFSGIKSLKSVSLPECLDISNHNAFWSAGIESLELPNIEYCTGFKDCLNLKTVSLPKAKTVGSTAFSNCVNLEQVYIPECEFIDDSAFYSCSKLISIEGPNVKRFGLQWGGVFNGCRNLKTANFPNISSINNRAFADCWNLESVTLGSVSYIASAFKNCFKLSQIDLPYCIEIRDGFTSCFSLESVSIPSCIKLASSAFMSCVNLKSIDLPKVSNIEGSAFLGCSTLSTIILRASSVVYLSSANAFYQTPISDSSILGYYGSIYVPNLLLPYYLSANNWSIYSSRITALENL